MKKLNLQRIAFSFKTEITEPQLNELKKSLRECIDQFTTAKSINVYVTKEEVNDK